MKITRAEYERLSPAEKQRIITESTPDELAALMGTTPPEKPKPKPIERPPPVTTTPPERVVQTNVKQGGLFGGWVCFGLGLLFMSMSLILFCILYVPLFLASFILSIVAMSQRRVLGGVTLLLATVIVPPVFGLVVASYRASELADKMQQYADTLPKQAPTATPAPVPVATAPVVIPTPAVVVKQPEVQKPKHPALDEKMGFREARLGMMFSDFNPDALEEAQAYIKTDMKPYFVKDFDKKIGAAEIDTFQLNFLQDMLESIRVTVKGEQSALGLKEALIAAYGKPDEENDFINQTLIWNGDDCVLQLIIEQDQGATADFSSKSVDAKIKAITEQKAKAGAAAGSKDL